MKKNISEKLSKIHITDILIYFSFFSAVAFGVFNFLNYGWYIRYGAMSSSFQFNDFFSHLYFAGLKENCYQVSPEACFPPFAYLFYLFFQKSTPFLDFSFDGSKGVLNFQTSNNALLVFIAYNFLLFIILFWCIVKYTNSIKTKYSLLLPIGIFFSYPVMFTSIQRGNSTFLVALLMCISWLWLNDENKVKRELSLILIAVAASMKIYPAIMGIILIKQKDWKRVLRLLAYGIIFFFGPFIFFGGLSGLKGFIKAVLAHTVRNSGERLTTVRGLCIYLFEKYSSLSFEVINTIGIILENIFLIIMLVLFVLSKKRWQEVMFITAICCSYVSSSWPYTLVYYLPTLMLFIKEMGDKTVSRNTVTNTVSALCISIIFSFPFYCFHLLPCGPVGGIIISNIVLLLVNGIEVIRNSFSKSSGSNFLT